ncbi:hypothetical protein [Belnapia rosea]|uniref:Uncharacterized protein n=1 Tax=Belnapia rosea TaxID=938405 RepID=A0A1G7C1R0_9PROT|nr:hypothetical protein [Belnapia rosea]SDE32710.1 hypothetical protein SAMN04487779_102834 [Belnapia rosea]
MFGFGAGRIGPEDSTLSKLERASQRVRIRSLPTLMPVCLGSSYLARIKALPRAEIVTSAELRAIVAATPLPTAHACDLVLPANEFLFEMGPMELDFVSRRVVHVRRKGEGAEAKLTVLVYSQTAIADWLVSGPGTMVTLSECESDPAHIRVSSPIGFDGLRHDMACASFGLAVLDTRQREMFGATRH